MAGGPTIMAWLDPEQADLVRRVRDRLGGELVAAGSPDARRAGEVAEAVGAGVATDLRSALASAGCEVVLLASPSGLGGPASQADVNALLEARARGVRIVSLTPLPVSAMDLHAGGWLRARQGLNAAECVRFVPLARSGRGFVAMRERLGDFGRISALAMAFASRPGEVSLGGQLFAAMHLAHSLLGEIESVDAAHQPPGPVGMLRPLPGETLHDLRGGITAHLRTVDGRGATLLASDGAGRWLREVTIVGDGGRMRVDDDGLEWIGMDGGVVDSATVAAGEASSSGDHGSRAIADAIAAVLGGHPAEIEPVDVGAVLALGQAALLSARTGQSESPETIRRMVRAG